VQIIHGRSVPDGPIAAAKEFVSLALSGLATERDKRQEVMDDLMETGSGYDYALQVSRRDQVQDLIGELGTVQYHMERLKGEG
jgi:hypothetical protein